MPRSPLFDLLRRVARRDALARSTGVPRDEIGEIDRTLRLRRRTLLAGAAAGAVAACAPRLPRERDDEPVVVVGAGIAGLTAAWRLRRAGVPVVVCEAQSRVGGRMLSLRGRFPEGQVVELGGELIDTGHGRIRALASELGLTLDDLHAGETEHPEVWFANGRHYREHEVLEAYAPIGEALERAVATLPDAEITYAAPGGAEALDRQSITEWLDAVGARGWLRTLIEVAYTTEMGLECDEQSALNLITFLDPGREAFRVFGESDERFHVRGGNDAIPSVLAERLGASVETGLVLESLRRRADGRHVLAFRRDGASVERIARHVVLAIPLTMLRQVRLDLPLEPHQRRAIERSAYGSNAKLMIGFEGKPWRRHGSAGSLFCDLPLQSTWETSRAQPGRHAILTNFTGGRQGLAVGEGSAEAQATRVVTQLEAIWPGIGAARGAAPVARMHWPTNPWVRGSYLCFRPGDWTQLRGALDAPLGTLHFAGEHCAMENQGFMEGGVESGEITAERVLAQRGVGMRAA